MSDVPRITVTAVRAFIKGHSIHIYFALTFAISWTNMLLIVGGFDGIPGTPEQLESMIPLVGLALLAGPSLAGVLLTCLADGKVGFRKLISRSIRWRLGARWYAITLLTAPLVMTAMPLALSIFFPELLPGVFTKEGKMSLLVFGLVIGLGAGVFEELGWTGFAIPRLRSRHSVLATGLIVGGLWGGWHLLVNFWSSGSPAGELSLALLMHSLLFSVGILPAFRILMVWVHDRTGSLLAAMLMHASLTSSNVILVPSATGVTLVVWSLVVAVAMWVVVAAVAMGRGGLRSSPRGGGR